MRLALVLPFSLDVVGLVAGYAVEIEHNARPTVLNRYRLPPGEVQVLACHKNLLWVYNGGFMQITKLDGTSLRRWWLGEQYTIYAFDYRADELIYYQATEGKHSIVRLNSRSQVSARFFFNLKAGRVAAIQVTQNGVYVLLHSENTKPAKYGPDYVVDPKTGLKVLRQAKAAADVVICRALVLLTHDFSTSLELKRWTSGARPQYFVANDHELFVVTTKQWQSHVEVLDLGGSFRRSFVVPAIGHEFNQSYQAKIEACDSNGHLFVRYGGHELRDSVLVLSNTGDIVTKLSSVRNGHTATVFVDAKDVIITSHREFNWLEVATSDVSSIQRLVKEKDITVTAYSFA